MKAFEQYRSAGISYPKDRIKIDPDKKMSKPAKLSAIPWNSNKFKGLNFSRWKFIDSMLFQKCSLSKLAAKLKRQKDGDSSEFEIFKQVKQLTHSWSESEKCYKLDRDKYDQVTTSKGKNLYYYHCLTIPKSCVGVIPYEAIKTFDDLQVEDCPPKASFKNRLTEIKISDEDYNQFVSNWNLFKFKNLLECVCHYVLQDTIW